ncbi:hypothetical protein DEH18_05270 [Streptomyces sp. NHF165]|uniref:hypothetical protein n=1 Tax=Streptomyces TaxID=1883 RepID=UPI0004C599FB|nr:MULTISPECIES: hypothetical protein [Streptomyces]QHF93391.1 hypothetical protein DEH18_05270 [Streptomyces sp. NHF165]
MTTPEEAPAAPVAQGPELEPVPVPECDVCQALAEDREAARAKGYRLTVRSCNAVIAGHPHGRGAR